jgi:hypothetical protein
MTGPARPAFARDWPADPELDALLGAFEAGNYALVRETAPKVAESAGARGDDALQNRALLVLARIEPDPVGKVIFGIAALLLVAVVAAAYSGSIQP